MPLRNPFDNFSFGTPAPKRFGMQGQSSSRPYKSLFQADYTPPLPSNAPSEQRQPDNDWTSYITDMQDLYTKQGPAAGAYAEHMNAIPEYTKPSKMQRFSAALVGGGEGLRKGAAAGWAAGQEVAQAPYRRDLEQWGLKEKALKQSADIEDDTTNRKIQFMKEARASAKDSVEAGRWMKEFDLKNETARRAREHQIEQEKQWKNSGYVSHIDSKGDTIYTKPGTGETFNAGTSSKVRDWANTERGLATGEKNARTAGRNADTNAAGLAVRQATEKRVSGREARYDNPPISAAEQSSARGSAMSRAQAENANWEDFVSPDGTLTPPDDRTDPEWNKFMQRVEEIETGIFGRRRNLGGGGGSTDEEVIEY